MSIDPTLPVPAWQQLAGILRQRIESGDLPPGRMPGEVALHQEYGVSVNTVRHALRQLRDDGLVKRVTGLGTFVVPGDR